MGGVILNFKKIFNNYFILKIVKALFTIIFVTTLIFFLIRLMPSSPVDIYVQELIMKYDFTIEEARSRAANIFSIELNSPLYVQYINYVKGVLRGDFGKSLLSPGVKVTTIIAKRLPWTLFTVGLGLIISFIVGITIGSLMALNRNKWYEPIITGFASVLSSIPNFLIAIFLIIIFGIVKWGDSYIAP
jgi:peptide/nickel transport system permease protein